MKKNNKGFTLVELIVVLVILAILAAILVPTLLGWIDKARSEKDYSTAQTVRVAAQAMIDQAYGNGKVIGSDGKTLSDVSTIGDMDGKITKEATGYGDQILGATGLAGVGTEVDSFAFNYEDGIIKNGWVKISGNYYKLDGGAWSAAGTTEPTFS